MDEFHHGVAEYRRQLIEFVRRRLPRSDRELGSDFVQDTLLEAWCHARNFGRA
jgi:DNA-directed RNA polymerase specialized sigma24 family protein